MVNNSNKHISFQAGPLDVEKLIAQSGNESDGAVVSFIGRPRNHSNNKEVLYLEYELYEPMARKELDKIVNHAIETWSLSNCMVVHRYGRVNISEASILIIVAASHRDEAYKASRYIIDSIKKTVPVWKKEFYTDGSVWKSERM